MIKMIKAKIKFVFLIIFFLILGTQLAHSQQGNIFTNFDKTITRADAYFDDYAFLSAIDLYKEVLEKEPENGYAKIKIARAYKKLNNYQEAEKWFRAAIEDNEYAQPLDQLYFAQVLMTNGKHQEARKWLVQYSQTQKDIRAIRLFGNFFHIRS